MFVDEIPRRRDATCLRSGNGTPSTKAICINYCRLNCTSDDSPEEAKGSGSEILPIKVSMIEQLMTAWEAIYESQNAFLESTEKRRRFGRYFTTCGERCDASLYQISVYLQHRSLRIVLIQSSGEAV